MPRRSVAYTSPDDRILDYLEGHPRPRSVAALVSRLPHGKAVLQRACSRLVDAGLLALEGGHYARTDRERPARLPWPAVRVTYITAKDVAAFQFNVTALGALL
jgi:hypothetical protein